MSRAPFPVVTLRNDSRCAYCRCWRILLDGVIVGETADTAEVRACAEELAVKPAAAAQPRSTALLPLPISSGGLAVVTDKGFDVAG